jgi:Glycosyl-4,4'-diaponeurosporenoate acyltransferase
MLLQFLGGSSPWLGLVLMVDVLGLAKIAEPLFTVPLPGALRSVRPWETDAGVYRRLGVPGFGRVLRDTPLRYLNLDVYLAGRQPGFLEVYRKLESAEAAHFWAAALFLPFIIYAWLGGHRWEAVVLLLIQVFLNVYPILHLRMVRGRLDRPLKRLLARKENHDTR